MKYLLLGDLPPCLDYTGGQVLYQLASFLKPGTLVCYIVRDPALNPIPVVAPELGDIPTTYDNKPSEHAVRLLPGRAGLLTAYPVEAYRRLFLSRAIRRRAVKFGREQRVTAVWAVLQGQTIVHLAKHVAEDLGVPLYTQIWDPLRWWLLHRRIDRFSRRRSFREFDDTIRASTACITASWAMAEQYEQEYRSRAVPVIFSLPRCVMIEHPPDRDTNEPFVIGMAGQVYAEAEWRSLLRLLDLVEWRVEGRRVEIHYAGGGMAKWLDHPNIKQLGWFSPTAVVRTMSKADVLYLPYWFSEDYREAATLSFPSKIVTYFAAGRPVFFHGPEYASPARYLNHHEAGICCHSLTPSDIYNTLSLLIRDGELRGCLTANGRSAFLRDFTREAMATNFHSALEVPHDQRVNGPYSDDTTEGANRSQSDVSNSSVLATAASEFARSADEQTTPRRSLVRRIIKSVAMLIPLVRDYVEGYRATVAQLDTLRAKHERVLMSMAALQAERDDLRAERNLLQVQHANTLQELQKAESDRDRAVAERLAFALGTEDTCGKLENDPAN